MSVVEMMAGERGYYSETMRVVNLVDLMVVLTDKE
jgi:hypothetical protein